MIVSDFYNSSILITGGTGSIGKTLAKKFLDFNFKRIIIFSRDELKQHEMRINGFDDESFRYFIGDVRDKERLKRAFNGVDYVIHAAALKQVPACEYNPLEAVKTNINGAENVIDAAIDRGVKKVIALSTDKAVNPINLYGATKLVAEKLFVQANAYSAPNGTEFSGVRYGNGIGSRGSVIPIFQEQAKTGQITITDTRMTRFWITKNGAANFIIDCIYIMHGGEVFVPKIPSMTIVEVAKTLAPSAAYHETGIRPGEKVHEVLISSDEARSTLETHMMYIIQPVHKEWSANPDEYKGATPMDNDGLASNTNTNWLTPEGLLWRVGNVSD